MCTKLKLVLDRRLSSRPQTWPSFILSKGKLFIRERKDVQLFTPWHSLIICHQGKFKVVPVLKSLSPTPWRRMDKWRYSANLTDLGTKWRWVDSFTLWSLYPLGKSPTCILDRRLGEPKSVWESSGEEKNFLFFPGIINIYIYVIPSG
jgi:hypothetical protein